MICLDTNVVIGVIKGGPATLVERFMQELPGGTLAMSAIVLFELRFGVANSARQAENTERLELFLQAPITVLPFDPEDAAEAGDIRAALRRAGKPVGAYDLLIAAQARRRGAVLVTSNAAEFAQVPGLRTEDWAVA